MVATGETHTVREFCNIAFGIAGFHVEWNGTGLGEQGRDRRSGKLLVSVNPSYYRPAEVDLLVGDAGKARSKLGWKPTTTFEGLVTMMVENDLRENPRPDER